MPKLQIIGPADPVNLPTASPESFGAGIGRAMQETGRVGQALGQVLQQVADSKAKSSAAAYEQELGSVAEQISLDPDIEGRGRKFESAQRKLQEKYRPKLGNRGLYDSASGMATMELRSRFDHKTMLDGIDEARRNTEINIGHKAMKAATAESDEEVVTLFQEIQNDLNEGSLYLTPAQQTQMFQNSMGASIRAMADTNPKRALEWIGRVGTMLPPEVLAVYRSEAITNIKMSAAAAVAEEEAGRKAIERAEKDRSKAAGRELVALDAAGALTVGDVTSRIRSGALSEEKGRLWLDRARNPSEGGSGGIDRDLYVKLSEAADRGDSVSDEVNDAYLSGKIGKTEHDALINRRGDVVFSEPRKAILGTLDPKNFGPNAARMGMPELRSDSLLAFDRWQRNNPDATIEQAEDKAQQLIKSALGTGKQNKNAKSLATIGGLGSGKRIETQEDVDKVAKGLRDKLTAGIIKQDRYDDEMLKLDEVAQSLDADSALGGGE